MNELKNIDDNRLKKYLLNIIKKEVKTRLLLVCNWTDTGNLILMWSKMLRKNTPFILVNSEEEYDYLIVINKPPKNFEIDRSKTILLHMEPNMTPPYDADKYFATFTHNHTWNIGEWHFSWPYEKILNESPNNKQDKISTVLSVKYNDPGQMKRIDFVKHIENEIEIDVYGNNKWEYKNYKGSLPYHHKDMALIDYKYTFNAENHNINNYVTEKLYDAILSETLCFYNGAPNVRELVNPMCYVELKLVDFEEDKKIIQNAMKDDLWSQRIKYIREEKEKILKEISMFGRLETIIFKK